MTQLLKITFLAVSALALGACAATQSPSPNQLALQAIVDAQPDAVRARYTHRHPKETIEYFGIEPGMTVMETLPGGGWYSKILLPYIGSEGRLIGANYAHKMWSEFGFFPQERIDALATWTTDWPAQAAQWSDGASIAAFTFGSLADDLKGTADVAFIVRALHNLARFDGYLDQAIADTYAVLKPGGIAGIVQHHAREDMPDAWATGSAGYLKKSFVIERMEQAGFVFVGESDINANPKDVPTTDDVVWRLPPSYQLAGDDAEKRAAADAIGESNRMTLKFMKPKT